jgi:aarF domain-containing kinase
VHYAVLHDGREVAVKVQHPWLREQCEGDISLLENIIYIGERIFPSFRYRWLSEELRINIPKELNFPLEVQNLKRCKLMLSDMIDVKVI